MPIAAIDTNVFFYATGLGESAGDRRKVDLAIALLADFMAAETLVVPAQVCLEFYHVLRRKGELGHGDAAQIVGEYTDSALIMPTDYNLTQKAFSLARAHGLQIYDAVVLAAAARAECEFLFSEDMQHGFEWQGVRIINPFA